MSIHIETKRLVLRQFTENDAVELNSICSQPYILKWAPDWKSSLEQRRAWIEWLESQYRKTVREITGMGAQVCMPLAVTLKTNAGLMGMIGIGNKKEVDNEMEIAFFISEEYGNHGYMTEAARAMTQWAFANLGLDYLIPMEAYLLDSL